MRPGSKALFVLCDFIIVWISEIEIVRVIREDEIRKKGETIDKNKSDENCGLLKQISIGQSSNIYLRSRNCQTRFNMMERPITSKSMYFYLTHF